MPAVWRTPSQQTRASADSQYSSSPSYLYHDLWFPLLDQRSSRFKLIRVGMLVVKWSAAVMRRAISVRSESLMPKL